MGVRSVVRNEAWRRAPVSCSARVLSSELRRRIRPLQQPVVRFDHGRSRIVADLRTALGLVLFRYGFDEPELDLVRMLMGPGDLFVDAGANIGLFALVAAARVGPAGKVIACEPSPVVQAVLQRNADLSALSWIDVRGVALGEAHATASFVVFDGDRAGCSSFAPEEAGGGTTQLVTVTTLDDLIPARDWRRLRCLKIDVEGAELRVLQGGRRTLAAARPDMLIEVEPAHLDRQGATVGALRDILVPLGYEAFRVRRSGPVVALVPEDEWDRPSRTPNLFLSANLERARTAGIVVGNP